MTTSTTKEFTATTEEFTSNEEMDEFISTTKEFTATTEEFTSNEEMDEFIAGDETISFTGYIDSIEGSKLVGKGVKKVLYKFVVNNGKGKKMRVLMWEEVAKKYEASLRCRDITLYCEDVYPFAFKRRQFPIKLAFAMTINKSQGQTFDRIGIDLRKNVFNHGQLYVAFSRVRSWSSLKIYLGNQRHDRNVKNFVYTELYDTLNRFSQY
ncbi:uncharacterized protein [Venturia canescens]|uniref:uncharacterized protein n=1 Tax=Venturia canescens TaxID=32260 RepID=UPI001C9C102B|nr:uncharacterized protein LOC122415215 [Venturia canescens]